MLTATCRLCGDAKPVSEYELNQCSKCTAAGNEGRAAFLKANPDASISDLLYAERSAMSARAHTAHRNFTDPRSFSRLGAIPQPPQGGVV